MYLHKKDETIDWDYKPENSYRLSDHWNFDGHGRLYDTDDYLSNTLLIGKYKNGKYETVKSFNKNYLK